MSKKKKHHKKRGYGGSMSVSLGSITSALKQSQFSQVALGAGVGVGAAVAADLAAEKALAAITAKWPNVVVPPVVVNLVPFAATAVLGGLLYAFRKDKQKAARNLAGALAAGLVLSGTKIATQYSVPGFKGLMAVNLGIITDAKRYGMITDVGRRPPLSLITSTARQQTLSQPARFNAIMEEEIG